MPLMAYCAFWVTLVKRCNSDKAASGLDMVAMAQERAQPATSRSDDDLSE